MERGYSVLLMNDLQFLFFRLRLADIINIGYIVSKLRRSESPLSSTIPCPEKEFQRSILLGIPR
jgi:hypothetical protein